jgi:hypothetical protein
MPTRLSILHTNRADSATLSVSPAENALFPIARTKTLDRNETLRTTGVSAQQLRAVWPANVSVNAVVLAHHNLTAAATWRVRLYSDAAFTTAIYDSTTVTAYDSAGIGALDGITDASFREYKNSVLWLPSTQTTVRSMTIDLTDAANPDAYLSAARLMAGLYRELDWNFDWGHPLNLVSPTTTTRAVGGARLSQYNGPVTRTIEVPLNGLAEADAAFLFDLIRVDELSGDMFVSLFPNAGGHLARRYSMWAAIKSWQGLAQPILGYFGSSVTFESL